MASDDFQARRSEYEQADSAWVDTFAEYLNAGGSAGASPDLIRRIKDARRVRDVALDALMDQWGRDGRPLDAVS